MPRVQTTRTVRFALILLRVYLIVMLVLIVVGFIRNRSSLRHLVHPSAGPETAAASRQSDAGNPGSSQHPLSDKPSLRGTP